MYVPGAQPRDSNKERIDSSFSTGVSTNAVTDAYGDLARNDALSFKGAARAIAVEVAEGYFYRDEPRIQQEEWKNSPSYRDDIEWYDGMTERSARIISAHRDNREANEAIIASATGAQNALGVVNSLANAIVDPLNLASGFGAAGVIGKVATKLPKIAAYSTVHQAAARSATVKQVAGAAAIEGVVAAAALEPIAYYSSDKLQQDYGAADTMLNVAASTVLSSGIAVLPSMSRRVIGGVGRKAHILKGVTEAKVEKQLEAALDKTIQDISLGATPDPESNSALTLLREREQLEAELSDITLAREDAQVGIKDAQDNITQLEVERSALAVGLDEQSISRIEAAGYNISDVVNAIDYVKSASKKIEGLEGYRPLLSLAKKRGGINLNKEALAGELKQLGLSSKIMPGVVNNKSGLRLDELTEAAMEAGVYSERPSINKLLEDLSNEVSAKPKKDIRAENNQDAESFLNEVGVSLGDLEARDLSAINAKIDIEKKAFSPTKQEIDDANRAAEIKNRLKSIPPKDELLEKSQSMVKQLAGEYDSTAYNYVDDMPDEELMATAAQGDIEMLSNEIDYLATELGIEDQSMYFKDIEDELVREIDHLRATTECFSGR